MQGRDCASVSGHRRSAKGGKKPMEGGERSFSNKKKEAKRGSAFARGIRKGICRLKKGRLKE